MPGPNQFRVHVQSSGLRTLAPVLPQVSNLRLTGRHRLDNDGGAAEVKLMQTPAGSEVSDVSLRVPATAVAAATFRSQLVASYGPPDAAYHDGAELSWCSPETLANCGRQFAVSGPLDNLYPLLFASAHGPTDDRIVHRGCDVHRKTAG